MYNINMDKRNDCLFCNCAIRNFKVTQDWKTRKYHKTCYKKMIERQELQEMMNKYKINN